MDIEIFTICDAAADYGGKLSILGTFNIIQAKSFPTVHPACAIVLRLRFAREERGDHTIRVLFVDADGNDVIRPIQGDLDIHVPKTEIVGTTNLVLNLQRIEFKSPGTYAINLEFDGEIKACLPFFVR